MSGYSLLRRIRQPELAAPRRVVSDDEVRSSILENLQTMCSTRLGSALSSPEYGVIAVSDIVHSCPDAIDDIVRSIRNTIRKFEPRLSSVVVTYVASDTSRDLNLRFDIRGQLTNGARRADVRFQTIIDATRNVRVE